MCLDAPFSLNNSSFTYYLQMQPMKESHDSQLLTCTTAAFKDPFFGTTCHCGFLFGPFSEVILMVFDVRSCFGARQSAMLRHWICEALSAGRDEGRREAGWWWS